MLFFTTGSKLPLSEVAVTFKPPLVIISGSGVSSLFSGITSKFSGITSAFSVGSFDSTSNSSFF